MPTSQPESSFPEWNQPTPEELTQLLEGFEIHELIGLGGMGAVYRGLQKSLNRTVAIKLLPPEIGNHEDFRKRFRREARAMAMLQHPNIVVIHDFGVTPAGHSYFVMEYIDGCDLREYAKNGHLDGNGALNAICQICDALSYAHSKGVVHRDIKPANVFLNSDGVVKVGDFGLAKLVVEKPGTQAGQTQTGILMGTPNYVAPEQITGELPVDHRADLYSLGVMFYEMLTGKLPRGSVRPPSQIGSFEEPLDPRVDHIVFRAMEIQRDHRYQDAGELRRDIDSMRSQPIRNLSDTTEKKKPSSALIIWIIGIVAIAVPAFVFIIWKTSSGPKQHFTVRNPIGNLLPLPTGHLVFKGEFAGKAVSIPEYMKNVKFDWVLENGPVGPIAHSPQLGVLRYEKDGWHSLVEEKVKMLAYPGSVWEGTSLNGSNELKWYHKNGKHGKFSQVTKVGYGGGTYRGGGRDDGSLLALTENGDIELIVFGTTMDWEYKEWIQSMRWKDMAIASHLGIENGALLLSQSGEVRGFNHKGLIELPEAITRHVASIHSGNDGINFAVIKENGEIFRFSEGQGNFRPGSLARSWSKIPDEYFDDRTPVFIECCASGDAIQLEDGFWIILPGKGRPSSPVFQDLISESPFKTLRYLENASRNHRYVIGVR
ncbi:MAG: serine/threonine-protein kinase [Verrucomicrobiales bacterium]|nr:serine/threonine-protein kinase [Verrucomicrobiales bacterium]